MDKDLLKQSDASSTKSYETFDPCPDPNSLEEVGLLDNPQNESKAKEFVPPAVAKQMAEDPIDEDKLATSPPSNNDGATSPGDK